MREDHARPKKKSYDRAQLEILGVDTAHRSASEIAILQLVRPRLEAYWEYLHRKVTTPWTEDRAYNIVLLMTGDEDAANHAATAVALSQPLPPEKA